MVVDQRNAGASVTVTTANPYTLDRWSTLASVSSKFSVQQNAGSVTPPVGFANYLGCTSLSAYAVAATDYFVVRQLIEGFNTSDLNYGTANAKTITISFQVYSSLTGTFGGAITNHNGTRNYPFSYSVPVANTWTTISITIAGDTSGTWIGATNGISLQVMFSLGTGSTYSGTAGAWSATQYFSATGATSVVGTNGATFYITGVQLEIGSTATPFERRLYNAELANCQRYYIKYGTYAGTSIVGQGSAYSTTTGYGAIAFPVTMRTTPAFSSSNLTIGDGVNSATSITSSTINGLTSNSIGLFDITVASGLTQFRPYTLRATSTTGYTEWSSEL
jgi:hypothetical protein